MKFLVNLAALLILASVAACGGRRQADMIILGGKVYTLETTRPQVEAVVVSEGVVAYLGSRSECLRYRGRQTEVVDLRGGVAVPGLVDAHAHLRSLGRVLAELNLVGTRSAREVRQLVLERQEQIDEGEWVTGRGWDQNDWEEKSFPTWRDLAGTEAHPVFLARVDGHAAWVNKKALEAGGIDSDTPDPKGGKIVRDERGEPTGVLIDEAVDLVRKMIPRPSREEEIKRLQKALAVCNACGLVGVHDAGVDSLGLELYRELYRRGQLTLRVYALLSCDDESFLASSLALGPGSECGGLLTVRAIKLFADGALGSRGAALLEPYSDDPGNRGILVTPKQRMIRLVKVAMARGFQPCIHAIGDRGNRVALDVIEQAQTETGRRDLRPRIEHAQVLSLEDIPRFARLGVIASVQPTHATSDMPWALDRLGPERIVGAYAWRKLISAGARLACGSDFPVEEVDPLLGIYAAVTRQDRRGKPPGGWCPGERMTREEALKGFSTWPAYAAFAEEKRGTVAVGKDADFTVFDRDLFQVPVEQIPELKVTYTIVGGRIVYRRD